jgi:hypothetical protein
MTAAALPEIVETKETLSGARKTFACRRLALLPDGGMVLLFISDSAVRVHGLALPAGTVTFGYFWPDRPYNVYHWMTAAGTTVSLYVNLADDTRFEDDHHLSWRDLTVDILLLPGAAPAVLDEDELPPTLPPATRAHIEAARDQVLASVPALTTEIEAASTGLWPRAFGAGAERRR